MKYLQTSIGKTIEIELSGKLVLKGMLIEAGSDIIVLYTNNKFLYLSIFHIHSVNLAPSIDDTMDTQDIKWNKQGKDALSFRASLINARMLFTEISLGKEQFLYGYITHVMNNYIIFYSSIYNIMIIPLHHIKWISPLQLDKNPYEFDQWVLPNCPQENTLFPATFEEQLKKYINKVIVLNIGFDNAYIGKLTTLHHDQLEIVTGINNHLHLNLAHIKSIYAPNPS